MKARRVLIIEDNADNLKLARILLAPLGLEITEARDGLRGVEAAKAESFDLILLDIQLPVMDGYQVAKALRKIPLCARTPIVAVTSFAMPGDREKALESGCTGYIEKPLDPARFAEQAEAFLAPLVP